MGVVRWCDGPGKLPVPGRPTFWMIVGQGPIALAVCAGGGGGGGSCLDIFYSHISLRHFLNAKRESWPLIPWGRAFHSCGAEQANDPLYSDV